MFSPKALQLQRYDVAALKVRKDLKAQEIEDAKAARKERLRKMRLDAPR